MKNYCEFRKCVHEKLPGSKFCFFDTCVNISLKCPILRCHCPSQSMQCYGYCPSHLTMAQRLPASYKNSNGRFYLIVLYATAIGNIENEK